ncbi:MAG: hypothetical protein ACR2N2_03925 [Acidimicrobiia bacterium]
MRVISRLGWHTDPPATSQELPHVRGVPLEFDLPEGATRCRSWPNRLGLLEAGSASDEVEWHSELAQPPEDGTISSVGRPDLQASRELPQRTRAFRRLLKSLAQIPGVELTAFPDAMCAIILTPGVPAERKAGIRYPSGVEPVPERLGEFPGGLQLRVDDSEWQRFDRYAATVQQLLAGDYQP